MQLLSLMALVMGTVHRIMTVPVKQSKVREPVVRAVPILMMDFDPITAGEVQSTPFTFTALRPQELLFLWREARISPQSQAPVRPVPIVRAVGACDFDMPSDRHVRMFGKRLGFANDNAPVFALPVPVHTPPVAIVRMAPQSPPAQLVMDAIIHLAKDGLRHDVGIVPRPAGNDGSQSLG